MYLVASVVCLSVCVCVCLSELCCLNRLTLIFGMGVDLIFRVSVDIRGSACRVQQRAIALKFGVKGSHCQSKIVVCVSKLADAVDRLLINIIYKDFFF